MKHIELTDSFGRKIFINRDTITCIKMTEYYPVIGSKQSYSPKLGLEVCLLSADGIIVKESYETVKALMRDA